jgi:hypothetical protein
VSSNRRRRNRSAVTLNIYQPSILALKAGTRVETKEGIYTPQTDEVWHSDKRYRELERQGY